MLNTKKDLCKNCSGEDANKPILTNYNKAVYDGKEYNSGEIMDPKNGGIINVIVLQSKDKLKVRGYRICVIGRTNIGISNFFRLSQNYSYSRNIQIMSFFAEVILPLSLAKHFYISRFESGI
jgi:hypothetical protein